MFLICHVTSRDHMFKGLCHFMSKASYGKVPFFHVGGYWSRASCHVTCHVTSPNHILEGSFNLSHKDLTYNLCHKDVIVLVCLVILQDHAIKVALWLSSFMGRSQSR